MLPRSGRPAARGLPLTTLLFWVSILCLVVIGNYALYLRRTCAQKAAFDGAALSAAEAAGASAAAEVKRLSAQVAYLTAPAAPASGARVRAPAPPAAAGAPPPPPPPPPPAARLLAPPPRADWRAPAPASLEPAPASPAAARALLVICYNRAAYLKRALRAVLARLPAYNRPHVYISQDGEDAGVTAAVAELRAEFAAGAPDVPFTHWRHPPVAPALRGGGAPPAWADAYYRLAQHFGWALARLFGEAGHPHVIILEDDLEVAPDFFDFMSAAAPLLDADASLLAASAYSDLGQPHLVADPRQVHRSDFFPGLGWMLNARTWKEDLGPKWPDSFWDDWLREPPQRKGRHILRPEVRAAPPPPAAATHTHARARACAHTHTHT
jgi:hypothetical protein